MTREEKRNELKEMETKLATLKNMMTCREVRYCIDNLLNGIARNTGFDLQTVRGIYNR